MKKRPAKILLHGTLDYSIRYIALYDVLDTGFLHQTGYILPLIQCVEVDAVDAAGAVLVDQADGVFHARFLEGSLLRGDGFFALLRGEYVREDPVLGNDLRQCARDHAAIEG